jgi:hypothetical protein
LTRRTRLPWVCDFRFPNPESGSGRSRETWQLFVTVHTKEEIEMAVLMQCLPLSFLLKFHDVNREGWAFSESALFFRLWNLFNPISDQELFESLTADQKAAYEDFTAVMRALPWTQIPSHPHISELLDDNLEPLKPSGIRLFQLLHPTSKSA